MIVSKTDASPANLQILFHESVTDPDLRQLTIQSIDTLVARSVASTKRAREKDAELAQLTDAINAPIERIIQGDPQAVSALEELRKRSLSGADVDTFFSYASLDATAGGITVPNRGDLGLRTFAGRPPMTLAGVGTILMVAGPSICA